MIRIIDCADEDPRPLLRARQSRRDDALTATVAGIIDDVRTRGDVAVLESARQFDAPGLESLWVTEDEFDSVRVNLPPTQQDAITKAFDRVMRFHEAQLYYLTETMERIENGDSRFPGVAQVSYEWSEESDLGGTLGQRLKPVSSAGIYVPGGKAVYPSSVLMNVGPANVAMVPKVFVASPAQADGRVPDAVLFAASCGYVSGVLKAGGAAAIAALALGTETIPRVDVLAGPGNRYVNEAKRQLWGDVGLDGYAGPSEVCVFADDSANPVYAAADFLTQIEHAEDNAGFLVCRSRDILDAILGEIERQVTGAPRESIMRQAMLTESLAIVARDLGEATDIINQIAPEHLSLAVADPEKVIPFIDNAGCILVGEWTPESAGDFAAGPSHTLPTGGAARFGSPVNVMNFFKFQSVIQFSRGDLEETREIIETLGEIEGFPAHAAGASVRFWPDASQDSSLAPSPE